MCNKWLTFRIKKLNDARYMVDRALLRPINDDVEQLDAKIISQFPREEFTLHSFDEVEGDTQHLY